ncbi:type I phosphomannose isomerase catalytic subunit [Neobacillus sp. 19]
MAPVLRQFYDINLRRINLEGSFLKPLFLKPVFKGRIWGGTVLKEEFGYDIPTEHTGECWEIAAHPNGPSVIENGRYARVTLDHL